MPEEWRPIQKDCAPLCLPGGRLGGLTSKAGMSFRFTEMMLPAAHSIKDSDCGRTVGGLTGGTRANQNSWARSRRIKRRVSKLISLNPLLGLNHYEPITRGISAARPYIDVFAPAHNLQSLLDLEGYLR